MEHVALFQAEGRVIIHHPSPGNVAKGRGSISTGGSWRVPSVFEDSAITREHAYNVAFKDVAVLSSVKFVDAGAR